MHPDLRQSIKYALRTLCEDPGAGEPLRRELEGLWKYRVRRFRIVYAIDPARRVLQVVAVGHRRTVYETLSDARRRRTPPG